MLQRPIFFSGQLLTEEDLQQLSDYAATKARLHNRFLHGSGVICGLLVTCNPCGGGKVTVQSGAALDCCGNDLHLPCAVELDINAMVAALRLETRGGVDCGDPCTADCKDSPDDVRCLDRHARRYDLYLHACETLIDPVAPYVTGGDCSPQVCKPTRIAEGYRFELRCPAKETPPDDLFRRISACIGDLFEAEKVASDAQATGQYARKQLAAREYIRSGQSVAFSKEDADGLDAVGVVETAALKRSAPEEAALGEQIDAYFRSAAALMRYDIQDEAARKELDGAFPGLAERAALVRRTLQASGPELKIQAAGLQSERSRLMAEAVVDQGMELTAEGADAPASDAKLSYALGAPRALKVTQKLHRDFGDWREWLLTRIEGKRLSADCRLRADLLAIPVPDPASHDETLIADASERLKEVLLRYLVDCICTALNPPCQPCADSGIKLATLTVADCEVTRICNLERTFVLSGPALRYWVPFLHTIGELFEKACCEFTGKLPKKELDEQLPPPAKEQKQASVVGYMMNSAPIAARGDSLDSIGSLLAMAKIDPATLRSRINLMGDLGRMALPLDRIGQTVGQSVGLAADGLATRARDYAATTLREDKALQEAVAAPLKEEITALHSKVDAVAGQAMAGAAVSKSVDEMRGQLADLSERMIDPAEVTMLRSKVDAFAGQAMNEAAVSKSVDEVRGQLAELSKRMVDPADVSALRSQIDAVAGRAANEAEIAKSVEDMRGQLAELGKRMIEPTEVATLRKALAEQVKVNEKLASRLGKLELAKKGG